MDRSPQVDHIWQVKVSGMASLQNCILSKVNLQIIKGKSLKQIGGNGGGPHRSLVMLLSGSGCQTDEKSS